MTDWAAPDKRAELWGRRVQYETAGIDVGDIETQVGDPVIRDRPARVPRSRPR